MLSQGGLSSTLSLSALTDVQGIEGITAQHQLSWLGLGTGKHRVVPGKVQFCHAAIVVACHAGPCAYINSGPISPAAQRRAALEEAEVGDGMLDVQQPLLIRGVPYCTCQTPVSAGRGNKRSPSLSSVPMLYS